MEKQTYCIYFGFTLVIHLFIALDIYQSFISLVTVNGGIFGYDVKRPLKSYQ